MAIRSKEIHVILELQFEYKLLVDAVAGYWSAHAIPSQLEKAIVSNMLYMVILLKNINVIVCEDGCLFHFYSKTTERN